MLSGLFAIVLAFSALAGEMLPPPALQGATIDLLKRYPTDLSAGHPGVETALSWDFTADDIFRVSQFHLAIGTNFQINLGAADLGLGHCVDGAVWAVLIPRDGGVLTSFAASQPEPIAHVWLRFNPQQINHLFPPETVFNNGAGNRLGRMQVIANAKIVASFHAGFQVLIPGPQDITVDVDTTNSLRRFFAVDTEAQTAKYFDSFESRPVKDAPALTSGLAEAAFDKIWESVDQKYPMFGLRPEVDWAKLRERYRAQALACKSTYEFASECANLLANLQDLHVSMTVAGAYLPVFNRPRSANFNSQACELMLGSLAAKGHVAWTVTTNQIGYLLISGWDDPQIPVVCGQALEQMRNTRGLIVDVRANGGGSEPLAIKVAGRFLNKSFVYAFDQYRNGPNHTNLTDKFERKVYPTGPWRYDRPVVLLIGEKCMSSNESFIGMMTGDPDLITMGNHTCGSSGNPEIISLPLDLAVGIPQWIDYLPDGTVLDERGFQPQVPFEPTAGAFEGRRDDLLAAALARLATAPLPGKPIPGPAFDEILADAVDHDRNVLAEAKDPARPKVISVSPPNGAEMVSNLTELHVRFDRPMDPLSLSLDWEAGGFLDCKTPVYDPARYEFTLPIRLAPGQFQRVVVNAPTGPEEDLKQERIEEPRNGFQSFDHHLAALFVWQFRTQPLPASSNPVPQVVSLFPATGSEVPSQTFLEIQFDQPMAPPNEAIAFLISEPGAARPRMIYHPDYDAGQHLFRIPLMLKPNSKTSFSLTGLRSAAGVAAKPILCQYRVSNEEMAGTEREKCETAARDPKLLDLLETMRQKRRQLTSLVERVQTESLCKKSGLFRNYLSQSAEFRWQSPGQYYADITQPMTSCSDFRIGSDGRNWWWRHASFHDKGLECCPTNDMQFQNISICDPFDLTMATPAEAVRDLGVHLISGGKASDSKSPQLEMWHIDRCPGIAPIAWLGQWQLDPQTYRPAEIKIFSENVVVRTTFHYDRVNESLPTRDFHVPDGDGDLPTRPQPLDANYTNRFVNLRDGSDGFMSVRWGKLGTKGISSSGLN